MYNGYTMAVWFGKASSVLSEHLRINGKCYGFPTDNMSFRAPTQNDHFKIKKLKAQTTRHSPDRH